jgi:hypothetical protein
VAEKEFQTKSGISAVGKFLEAISAAAIEHMSKGITRRT